MTNDEDTSVRIVGNLRALDGRGVVRMEDRYRTDINDLWSALTDPHRLARWIADVHGALYVGGEFHARFTSGWDGPGRVDVCEPPRFLVVGHVLLLRSCFPRATSVCRASRRCFQSAR